MTSPRDSLIVSAEQLIGELAAGSYPVLLDVSTNDRRSHIPGAVRVDWRHDLVGRPTTESGDAPLPHPAEFERSIRAWGINDDSAVVVYGDRPLPMAARAWFLLRWAGVRAVRYLDGGWDAWVAADGPATTEEPIPALGDFHISPGSAPTLTADDAARLADRGVLIDARGPADYSGGPGGKGGHIPGAHNVPYVDTIDEHGQLLTENELRARFETVGTFQAPAVGVYCGGGTAASHHALVLASLGIDASVYVDSWSGWSKDPARPVSRGADRR